ncbi:MAG TPA: hypothetical protein VNA16_01520 [Abditibacteriaceae bacterium]|nr:hypothetical protein [Abditibacteriaceae bacterium]
MADITESSGATDTATEIAGQATDDLVPTDLSRADDKADSGTSEEDAGTGSTLSLDDVEIPGAAYEIGSASGGADADDSASAARVSEIPAPQTPASGS